MTRDWPRIPLIGVTSTVFIFSRRWWPTTLNCWLMLLQRDEGTEVATLRHTTLATARLKFLFIAAKIRRHAGRTGISYTVAYPEQAIFQRLMDRLRRVTPTFTPVITLATT